MRKRTYRQGIRIKFQACFSWNTLWGKKGKLNQCWRIFTNKPVLIEAKIAPENIKLFERFKERKP